MAALNSYVHQSLPEIRAICCTMHMYKCVINVCRVSKLNWFVATEHAKIINIMICNQSIIWSIDENRRREHSLNNYKRAEQWCMFIGLFMFQSKFTVAIAMNSMCVVISFESQQTIYCKYASSVHRRSSTKWPIARCLFNLFIGWI